MPTFSGLKAFGANILLNLLARPIGDLWRVGSSRRSGQRPVWKMVGMLLWPALIGFGLYNVFSALASGEIYRLARRGGSGWISFGDDPLAFAFWGSLYSLPLVVPLVLLLARIAQKRQGRRDALRRFADGGGSAPIVRKLTDR